MIQPYEHQIKAAIIASTLYKLEGVDKAVAYLRAQMHLAAASGDYVGEARNGVSFSQEDHSGEAA